MNHHRKWSGTGTMTVTLAVIILFLLSFGVALSRAAEIIAVPDSIDLSEYNGTAGVVTFLHKDHGSTGGKKPVCSDCHHTTALGQTPQKCSVCHMPIDDTAAPTDAVAFHKLCIGCHKAEIGRGDKHIDLGCGYCHVPES
jgi:hypothetical protein